MLRSRSQPHSPASITSSCASFIVPHHMSATPKSYLRVLQPCVGYSTKLSWTASSVRTLGASRLPSQLLSHPAPSVPSLAWPRNGIIRTKRKPALEEAIQEMMETMVSFQSYPLRKLFLLYLNRSKHGSIVPPITNDPLVVLSHVKDS